MTLIGDLIQFVSGTKALSSEVNQNFADIKTAHNDLEGKAIKKDGSVAFTGAINAGSQKLTALATPTADTDGATKKYVDDQDTALGLTKAALAGLSSQVFSVANATAAAHALALGQLTGTTTGAETSISFTVWENGAPKIYTLKIGTYTGGASGNVTITFADPFTNECIFAAPFPIYNDTNLRVGWTRSYSASSCMFRRNGVDDLPSSTSFFWVALGK
jgi:hypothetical protein